MKVRLVESTEERWSLVLANVRASRTLSLKQLLVSLVNSLLSAHIGHSDVFPGQPYLTLVSHFLFLSLCVSIPSSHCSCYCYKNSCCNDACLSVFTVALFWWFYAFTKVCVLRSSVCLFFNSSFHPASQLLVLFSRGWKHTVTTNVGGRLLYVCRLLYLISR